MGCVVCVKSLRRGHSRMQQLGGTLVVARAASSDQDKVHLECALHVQWRLYLTTTPHFGYCIRSLCFNPCSVIIC